MGGDLDSIGIAEARSALRWWLDAGVDVVVQEQARNWLKPVSRPEPAPVPADAEPPPNIAQPSHSTLDELQQWLASTMQLPLASATARRIMPHGAEGAEVMLLSDSPTIEDYSSGQPIGGEAWKLALKMLAAIQVPVENSYSASLSCFHVPGSRMSPADREACAEVARRHIRLARPKRLLLLGDGPSQALIGKPLVQARGHVHKIEGVRSVATFHPRHLINQPSNKSLAWKDLLLLMEKDS